MENMSKEIQWVKYASLFVVVLAIGIFALGAFFG